MSTADSSSSSLPATVPGWVTAADLLVLLLIVVAGLVAVFGGSRVWVGGWRLSVTSAARPLLLALLLAALRHWRVRQPPVYRLLPSSIARWLGSAPSRAASLAFFGTRPAVFLVGVYAVLMIGYAPRNVPNRVFDNEFLNLPSRWDAGWYMEIARRGYTYRPDVTADVQQNIAFFPALPMMIRAVASPLGTSAGDYMFAGTLISLVAFFLALAYLYLFARECGLVEDEASACLWLTAAYPFALFYGAIYTESLFLLASVGAFYHYRRSEFLRAGAWGLLIGLTRPNGCFLAIPLAVFAISRWLPAPLVRGGRAWPLFGSVGAAPTRARRFATAVAAAAMPGIGVLVYSAFVWWLTGKPFAWADAHGAWGRQYEGLLPLVTKRYDYIAHAGLVGYLSELPIDVANLAGVVFALATVWPVARRLGLPYAVFMLVNILPPLAAGGLLSAGRLTSVLFPAFVWMASVVPSRHRPAWLVSFGALQALNAALFYTWRPLY